MDNNDNAMILVDAHVHIYDCFEIDTLLDAAITNFNQAAHDRGLLGKRSTAVLLLAETSRDNWFQKTCEEITENQHSSLAGNNWDFSVMPDKVVVQARKRNEFTGEEQCIFIMAGRQIVSAEGLELLALASDIMVEDGLPISIALDAVRGQGAIPVLPWAVGKWLGKRGKLLSAILDNEIGTDLCLGDNGGRPVFWRNPSHFYKARVNKFRLLPGTDPLPFPDEAQRVGSFGFTVNGRLSIAQPSTDLKRIINDSSYPLTAYGQLETSLRFFANQFRLRVA